MLEVLNALLYIASAGYAWRNDCLFESINTVLVNIEDREASPSVSVIYSPSVKTTKSGGHRD